MAEYSKEISDASKEVKKYQSDQNSPAKLKQYAKEIGQTADDGVSTLKKTKVESKEATAFLDSSVPKVTGYLKEVATKGSEIVAQNKKKEEIGTDKYDSIDGLHGSLKTQLNVQSESIGYFAMIEAADKGYETIVAKLKTSNAGTSLADLNDLQKKLPPSMGPSKAYRDAVDKKFSEKIKEITDFLPVQVKVGGLVSDIDGAEKLVAAYEKDPTPENLAAAQVAIEKINPRDVSNKYFVSVPESNTLLSSLYANEYWDAKGKLEGLPERLKSKEKNEASAEAAVVLSTAEDAYKEVIWPDLKIYYYGNKGRQELHESDLENRLLSNLLKTKGLLSKYASLKPGTDVDWDTGTKLATRYGSICLDIESIERHRLEFRNVDSAISKGIGKYITFPENPSEREIYHYGFTSAYYELSKEDQLLVKFQADEICAKNQEYVKKQTVDEALKFASPEEKIKILKERMGEKATSYFSGLEKLKAKPPDLDAAVSDFQAYIALGNTFTDEEKKLHAETIQDAKEKIHAVFGQKLDTIDSLFKDIKGIKWARQQLVSNPELKPTDGACVDAITNELAAFRKEVNEGKVTDFEKRFSKLKEKAQEAIDKYKEDWGDSDIITDLDSLRLLSQEKDPEKRKKGFTEFATKCRDKRCYKYAQKYLDYALEDDYKEASKGLKKDEVLKKMLGEKDFMVSLDKQTDEQYDKLVKENPGLKGLSREKIRQELLNAALDGRYKMELRRFMTGDVGTDPVVKLYNNWFPLDKPDWYKPWDYGAEEWDDFWDNRALDAVLLLATVGIGSAAAGAGRVGAGIGGRLVTRYLIQAGLTQAEIALIEAGGVTALRASLASGRALSFGAARLAGSVVFEAATMYGLGLGMEYIQTGKISAFDTPGKIPEGFAETMLKVSVFKAIGLVQSFKPIANAIKKGGVVGKSVWLGAETLNGAGGTILDAALAKAKGHDFTGKDVFTSMVNNYLTSMGMGIVHGKAGGGNTEKVKEAYTKEKIADAEGYARNELGIDLTKPDTVIAAHVTPEGQIIINGKVVKDPTMIALLPKKVVDRIGELIAPPKQPVKAKAPNPDEARTNPDDQPTGKMDGPIAPEGNVIPTNVEEYAQYVLKNDIPMGPEQHEMVLKAHADGMVKTESVLALIEAGKMPASEPIVDRLIENSRISVVKIVESSIKLTPKQQARVIDRMMSIDLLGASTVVGYCDSGKIDIHAAAVHDKLLTYSDGQAYMVNKIMEGKFASEPAVVKKVVDKITSERQYLDTAQLMLDHGAIPDSIKPEVTKRIEDQRQVFADSDIIGGKAFEDLNGLKGNIKESIEGGLKDPNDKVTGALSRLKERDPQAFKVLEKNLDKIDTDYMQAIIEGKFTEFTDSSGAHKGKKIRAYIGRTIGEGGMGNVALSAYTVEGSDVLQFAAIKKAHENRREFFRQERQGAELVQGWNDPHINRPLHIGEDVIIYESGQNANALGAEFGKASPRQSLMRIKEVLQGLMTYRNKGYFHGDLKEANVIVIDTPEGRQAVIIDNNPVRGGKDALKKGWVSTPPYTPNAAEMGKIYPKADQSYGAIDLYALGAMLEGWAVTDNNGQTHTSPGLLGSVPADAFTPQQREQITKIAGEMRDANISGNLDAIPKLIAELDGIIPTISDTAPAPRKKISLAPKPQNDVNALPKIPGGSSSRDTEVNPSSPKSKEKTVPGSPIIDPFGPGDFF